MSDQSALDRLSKKLDSGTAEYGVRRRGLFSRNQKTPSAWEDDEEKNMPVKKKRSVNTLEAVFGFAVAFFLIAVAVAGLILFSGNNTISTKNVDIQITGPTEIGAGSTLSLQVVITNRNTVPMELTDLLMEFPPGTRSDTDAAVDLPRTRQSLGTIRPGESVNRTIRATVFGTAGSDLTVKATTEYRVPSSNAIYVRDATYTAKINQSPAAITVDALKEAVSGQQNTFSITVTSNAEEILKDVLLLANYPPGFSFSSSDPAPVAGSAAWFLGDIEPGGKRTVILKGSFTGEDGDSRVIALRAGTRKTGQDAAIVAPMAATDLALTITKPFVSLALSLNGSAATTHTIERGKEVSGQIRWTNNLPVKVQNVEITLSFQGAILDKTEVAAQNGFFSSNNSTILWSKATDPDLADIGPGESETLLFTFATLPSSQGTFKNPQIHLSANVKAERQSETNVPVVIQSSAAADAFVASDLSLTPSLQYVSGPMPPKADKETVYAVTWAVANSANALANTSVTAILPSYVRFVGSQEGSSLSYKASGRLITWSVGDMASGQSRNASFQVAVTPSLSQVGTPPVVVGTERVSGYDRFVRGQVDGTAPDLLTTSDTAAQGGGVVVP